MLAYYRWYKARRDDNGFVDPKFLAQFSHTQFLSPFTTTHLLFSFLFSSFSFSLSLSLSISLSLPTFYPHIQPTHLLFSFLFSSLSLCLTLCSLLYQHARKSLSLSTIVISSIPNSSPLFLLLKS